MSSNHGYISILIHMEDPLDPSGRSVAPRPQELDWAYEPLKASREHELRAVAGRIPMVINGYYIIIDGYIWLSMVINSYIIWLLITDGYIAI